MSMSQEDIEALMNETNITDIEPNEDSASAGDTNIEDNAQDNIDDILANIDNLVDGDEDSEELDVDDIMAGMSDIKLDVEADKEETVSIDKEEIDRYPLPAVNENKVVNQLNAVAEDTEEKASQILDALSYILDRNVELAKANKTMVEFIINQIELLESLTAKFPNVSIFGENLNLAKELLPTIKDVSIKLTDEDNKIYEAMELMQYHDINRQKIERVMAVIKKLSGYLNGIFEDNSGKPDTQIAKHISGDDGDIVGDDDIDALINQYSE